MGEQTDLPASSIHLEAPPNPLPPTWEQTIANSIAEQLRRGWRTHTKKSTMHPTGAPRGHAYSSAAPFDLPKDLPNTYTEHEELFVWAWIEPTTDRPWLAWYLPQLDLAAALIREGLMQHHELVRAWLRRRPGPTPDLYAERANRHGNLKHRRNAPAPIIDTFHTAARAATVWLPTEEQIEEAIREGDRMSPAELRRALSSPGNAVAHGRSGEGARS